MNSQQIKLQRALDQVKSFLPGLVERAGYGALTPDAQQEFPPEEGREQILLKFRARKGNNKMTLVSEFNISQFDPTSPIAGDMLSLVLTDADDETIKAGESIGLDKMPGHVADGIPQFVLPVQAFQQSVRNAEKTLDERRREAARKTGGT